jgi:hypothetical protein
MFKNREQERDVMPDRLINKRTDKLKTQLMVEKHDPLK